MRYIFTLKIIESSTIRSYVINLIAKSSRHSIILSFHLKTNIFIFVILSSETSFTVP